jgi:hypothetical protein
MRSQNNVRYFGERMAREQRLFIENIQACTGDLAG